MQAHKRRQYKREALYNFETQSVKSSLLSGVDWSAWLIRRVPICNTCEVVAWSCRFGSQKQGLTSQG